MSDGTDWIEKIAHGQGNFGHRCVLCLADDYATVEIEHTAACPAIRFPTRKALFGALNEPVLPLDERRRLGRTIRRLVDESLRYGDGSGEATARAAFDELADSLDSEHDRVQHDMEVLLDKARDRGPGL